MPAQEPRISIGPRLRGKGMTGRVTRSRVSAARMLQRAGSGCGNTRSGMGLRQRWRWWSRRKASVPVIARHSLQTPRQRAISWVSKQRKAK
jgi:hypothetical protein